MKTLTIERLGPPFASNCVVYEPQFRSRKHCFNECILKRGIKDLKVIPLSAMYSAASEIPLAFSQQFNKTLRADLDRVNEHCLRECHSLDCFEQVITPLRLAAESSLDIIVDVVASMDLTSKSTEIALLPLVEAIIFVGGCFGMYFGKGLLDMFDSIPWLWKMARKLVNSNQPSVLTHAEQLFELDRRVARLEEELPFRHGQAISEHQHSIGQHDLRHRQPLAAYHVFFELQI